MDTAIARRGDGEPSLDAEPILTLRGMSKAFGGTLAVDGVDCELRAGEVLALLGQNGAGKSTVIKMLAGVYAPDAGQMRLCGAPYDPRAQAGAIAFIHQDLGLIDWMTVAENIALAQGYPRRFGLVDWTRAEAIARRSLAGIADDIDPRRRVGDLTRTEKSLVAIARAVSMDVRVLVLDEPTASLPQGEVSILFGVLRSLKRRGVGMIYVSHRLDEVFAISDRLVVMRDGRVVDARPTREARPDALIEAIVGRRPESLFVRAQAVATKPVLVCQGLTCEDVGPLSFAVGGGEIVALIGLRGAGQEAVGRALVGAGSMQGGAVTVSGRPHDCATPAHAIRGGLGFVAGDRVLESVAPTLSVRENMFVNPAASGRRHFHWRKPAAERAEARRFGRAIGLSPNDPEAAIETLSGGNQQKVVLARWMRIGPHVLVLEDPTAGVDVGAKAEIYRLLGQSLAGGQAILLISTDFEEVAAICHRALIFRNGQIVAELAGEGLSTQALTRAATMNEPAESVH